ncbi:MAG: sensor histidine kinase [Pseudobacter sp.]|uniref:sensor histidine kinase n=1 Tax=Pseudobacter sp. TaxID=2045420 RepID=UPI003F8071DB
MTKLLNRSLQRLAVYAGLVLVCSIPVYYFILSRLWQYELDEHNIVLTKEADREDSYLIILILTSLTVLFFALMLTGFILLNRRISKDLWKPFYNSLAQIRTFDLNRHNKISFEASDIDEFDELNHSLDKLIGSSVAAYNQQKEFADNASHELQTPLAIIQSKLDLLLQSKSLTSEQYNIIEDALKASARVARINKNLLLLTKIENSQFMEKEQINLSALLRNAITVFSNFTEDKYLVQETQITENVFVEGNQLLVEILVNNLLTNAIRYSPVNGTITTTLRNNSLMISNAGTTPLNQEQLFKRFGTSSTQTPGTGLGLALVKQISSRYGWRIEYSFNIDQHVFSLYF